MAKTPLLLLWATVVLIISITPTLGQSAAQLLKEGSSFQAADDTSDHAADLYRQIIRRYPRSTQAEYAQFYLGTYYQKKFFIIEQRSKLQDWDSLNKADEALYSYVAGYPRGGYLADAYHTLAIIALRRGYKDTAKSLYSKMSEAKTKDKYVYIFRLTWSTSTNDVIKGYCDPASLASASIDALNQQSSFDRIMNAVTSWARGQCH